MDPQLLLFHRQYLQLFEPDFLAWPPKPLLRDPNAQNWLFHHLFDSDRNPRLPPPRYQVRVLKSLIARIEQAIEDPDEDEISNDLMSHLTTLLSTSLPSETTAAQQKSYVTFSFPAPFPSPVSPSSEQDQSHDQSDPSITLLERRNLISGSRTTGYRTWEASLHLAAYLLTPQGRALIRDKSVFELGAGTGFVSILCAKYLGARQVIATDGDEGVVDALGENFFINGVDERGGDGRRNGSVTASVLRWGQGLKGTWVEEEAERVPFHVVLGADVTYDKPSISALVATLRFFFDLSPGLRVLISGAVRNADTFEFFRQACVRSKFEIEEVNFEPKPIREQTALFYATAVPLKILLISRSSMEG